MHWHIATARKNDPATIDIQSASSFGSEDQARDEVRYRRNRDDESEMVVVECWRTHGHVWDANARRTVIR